MWHPADIAAARRQARALGAREHRPWPVPERPWVMGQTWEDLLFAHWPVDPERLRHAVPPQIPIDTFEGSAWIAVTPFVVTGMRARLTLPMPGTARFPEINVRTYATIDGKPGIWFFSLDTSNRPAIQAARRVYRLPYFRSRMRVDRDGGGVTYSCERTDDGGPPAAFEASYEAVGAATSAAAMPGSFEEWATERYCLYTLDGRQRVLRGDIHHPPWKLRPAQAQIDLNTMAAEVGVELDGEPRLHLAERQDVVFWLLERA